MELRKHDWMQILICLLIDLICVLMFVYKTYILPKSYTIGNPTAAAYEKLPIKDYISNDDVLFSANMNDISFANKDGVATYEMNFEPQDFNGLLNNYAIFINNDIVLDYTQNAGSIKAIYPLTYKDIENQPIKTSNITIDCAFHTQSSTLRITLPSDGLGLLMNYFKNNDFTVTIVENPFTMNSMQSNDELGRIDCSINVTNEGKVYVEHDSVLQNINSTQLLVNRNDSLNIFTVLNKNIKNIVVDTDGQHTISYSTNSNEYTVSWTNANYVKITVNYTAEAV